MKDEILSTMAVSVSISESPDLPMLGMGSEHLQDAMYEVATHLLANGADLAYGGDLRPGGFTEMLFELLYRYQNGTDAGGPYITNYLPWPVHIGMGFDKIKETASGLRQIRLKLIGRSGEDISIEERQKMPSRQPDKEEWSEGLTAMRKRMCTETDARVALGGKVEGYQGKMPGVAEEVLLSLESRRPVFLIGGFGGCVGGIAETMGLVDFGDGLLAGSRTDWAGRHLFNRYGSDDLGNGLTGDENSILAESPYIGQAVTLILKGIYQLRKGEMGNGLDQGR